MTRPAIPAGLSAGGVVAIGRRISPEAAPAVAEALAAGGVLAFELTLNDPEADALRAIESAAAVASRLGLDIGAGTVLSVDAARRAIDAGATFLVMPHLDTEIVSWAAERGIPVLPGCATPTEVLAGWRAGAAAIKVFPASSLGPVVRPRAARTVPGDPGRADRRRDARVDPGVHRRGCDRGRPRRLAPG